LVGLAFMAIVDQEEGKIIKNHFAKNARVAFLYSSTSG